MAAPSRAVRWKIVLTTRGVSTRLLPSSRSRLSLIQLATSLPSRARPVCHGARTVHRRDDELVPEDQSSILAAEILWAGWELWVWASAWGHSSSVNPY